MCASWGGGAGVERSRLRAQASLLELGPSESLESLKGRLCERYWAVRDRGEGAAQYGSARLC